MELTKAIYGRRAIRTFKQVSVSRETLKHLVDAAIQAPSAMNEQPWCFYITDDAQKLDRLSAAITNHLRVTISEEAFRTHREETREDATHHIFHGAPVLIVIASHYKSTWAIEDCFLAAQNLMLMAHSMGLGTCLIGSALSYFQTVRGRKSINLAEHHRAVAPVVIGYPASVPSRIGRAPARVRWLD